MRLNDKDTPQNLVAQNVIAYVLDGILKLLHPFMPFITEEIFSSLPHTEESIMIAAYPSYDSSLNYADEAAELERTIAAIKAIRTRRNEMNVAPSRKARVYILTKFTKSFGDTAQFFTRLASASDVLVSDDIARFDESFNAADCVQIITDSATVYLPLSDIIDVEKERARLSAEKAKLAGEIKRVEGKLSNEGFVAKAPAAVVDGERAKLEKYRQNLAGVEEALAKLK